MVFFRVLLYCLASKRLFASKVVLKHNVMPNFPRAICKTESLQNFNLNVCWPIPFGSEKSLSSATGIKLNNLCVLNKHFSNHCITKVYLILVAKPRQNLSFIISFTAANEKHFADEIDTATRRRYLFSSRVLNLGSRQMGLLNSFWLWDWYKRRLIQSKWRSLSTMFWNRWK